MTIACRFLREGCERMSRQVGRKNQMRRTEPSPWRRFAKTQLALEDRFAWHLDVLRQQNLKGRPDRTRFRFAIRASRFFRSRSGFMNSPTDSETSLDSLFASARVVHRRNFLTTGAAALMTAAGADVAFAKPAADDAATDQDRKFMGQAVELMRKAGVVGKTGGPFGAVVAMNGEIVSSSGNSVLRDNDPSAHAEINAIRMACKKDGSPHIKGATLFP